MFETMIPSPLSFFGCLVVNIKFFVVPCYVRDYDSKSFVVLWVFSSKYKVLCCALLCSRL